MRRVGASCAAIIGVPSGYAQAIFLLAGVRGAIVVCVGALSVLLAALQRANERGAIGRCRSALAVRLAFAICLAGVRHAASIGAPSRCRLAEVGRREQVPPSRQQLCSRHLFVVFPLAGYFGAIGKRQCALAIEFVATKLAGVLGSIC